MAHGHGSQARCTAVFARRRCAALPRTRPGGANEWRSTAFCAFASLTTDADTADVVWKRASVCVVVSVDRRPWTVVRGPSSVTVTVTVAVLCASGHADATSVGSFAYPFSAEARYG